MRFEIGFALLFLWMTQASSFAPVGTPNASFPPRQMRLNSLQQSDDSYTSQEPLVQMVASEKRGFFGSRIAPRVAGLCSGLCGYVTRGMAEDVEYAELPPPYIPAIFGVVLLAGVGVLTVSLGDVMSEGMSIRGLSCSLPHDRWHSGFLRTL